MGHRVKRERLEVGGQKEIRSQPPSPHGFRLRYNSGETSRRAKEVGSRRSENRRQQVDYCGFSKRCKARPVRLLFGTFVKIA